MPHIRDRKHKVERRARAARRVRRRREAKELIDFVKHSGVPDRQSVVLLVFDLMEGEVAGYANVDPVVAALALMAYLDRNRRRKRSVSTTRRTGTHA